MKFVFSWSNRQPDISRNISWRCRAKRERGWSKDTSRQKGVLPTENSFRSVKPLQQ
jgi:hypothetical protein